MYYKMVKKLKSSHTSTALCKTKDFVFNLGLLYHIFENLS